MSIQNEDANPCERALDVTALLRGELEGHNKEQNNELEEHINICVACKKQINEERAVFDLLQNNAVEPSPELKQKVMGRINLGENKILRMLRDTKWRVAAAVLVAAVMLTLLPMAAKPTLRPQKVAGQTPPPKDPTQLATERAHNWLRLTQEADGSWSASRHGGASNYSIGLTGLASIALLSGFEEMDTDKDASIRAVLNAGRHLISKQAVNGRIGPNISTSLYNHGIATVALLGTYAATKEETLREPIERALKYIVKLQSKTGGWGYASLSNSSQYNSPQEKPNTSISAWQISALLMAENMGFKNVDGATRLGLEYLAEMADDTGRVGYSARGRFQESPQAMTAMAALYFSLKDIKGELKAERGRIIDAFMRARVGRSRELDYYQSFFVAYAARANNPDVKNALQKSAREVLLASQVSDGPNSGSFAPRDRWSNSGGRIYATAMASMSLHADTTTPRMLAQLRGGQ